MQPLTSTPPTGKGIDISVLFTGPALWLVDMQVSPTPDGRDWSYVATFETGEVLEVHDAAVAATLGVAMEQARPVQIAALGQELVAARLAPKPPAGRCWAPWQTWSPWQTGRV